MMDEREIHEDLREDPEMVSRLRSVRPRPNDEFVSRLEAELFTSSRRRTVFAWRPVAAASAAAMALAVLALALGLAGLGPFGGDSEPVQAGDECRLVTVTKRERIPVLVRENGAEIVRFETRRVKRQVRRCH
jgi:hypothetical protein